MNKRSFLLFLFSLIIICNSCHKTLESQLPPHTQKGANTAGCIIDGRVWIAEACIGIAIPPEQRIVGNIYYFRNYKSLKVDFQKCKFTEYSNFNLSIENFIGPGKYICDQNGYNPYIAGTNLLRTNAIFFSAGRDVNGEERYYATSEQAKGFITITRLDTLHQPNYASGIFEGVLKNCKYPNDSLVISNGRFDISYQ